MKTQCVDEKFCEDRTALVVECEKEECDSCNIEIQYLVNCRNSESAWNVSGFQNKEQAQAFAENWVQNNQNLDVDGCMDGCA